MKKLYLIMFLTLFLLISFIGISSVNANSYAMSTEDIGYHDCWLHSDGVTWQNGIKPGSTITHTFKVTTPIDKNKTLKSYSVSFLSNIQGKYTDTFYKYAVDNGNILDYNYLGNSEMQYTIKTTLRANEVINGKDITKEEQAELVQGRRFYIPVLINWEYANSESSKLLGWGAGGVGSKSYYYGEVNSYSVTTAYWYLLSPNTLVAKYTYSKSNGWQVSKIYKSFDDLRSIYGENAVDRYCLAAPWWIPNI